MHDILLFDAEFGKILQEMQALVRRKQFIDSNPENNQKAITDLHFRGTSVKDLCLDFTLPGYPDYVLKQGGENIMVIIRNCGSHLCILGAAILTIFSLFFLLG